MTARVKMGMIGIFVACAFALLMVMPAATASASPVAKVDVSTLSLDKSSERDFDVGLQMFLVKDPRSGVLYFDSEKAKAAGASEDLLTVGSDFNQVTIAHNDRESRIGLPVWGKYCGPGHSGPGKPIDYLDTACMHHDACYGRKGYFSVSCDKALIREINTDLGRMGRAEKAMAYAVRAYFKAQIWWNS